jgi:hypothetical protein
VPRPNSEPHWLTAAADVPQLCTVPRERSLQLTWVGAADSGRACRALLSANPDESPPQFQERVRKDGPARFQAAIWQVHAELEKMASWPTWTASQQKLGMRVRGLHLFAQPPWRLRRLMCDMFWTVRMRYNSLWTAGLTGLHTPDWHRVVLQATQMFLLRAFSKKGLDLMASADVEAVDLRLATLCRALGGSLELQHWKFEDAIKKAILGTDETFAVLCQAAEPLSSLVRCFCMLTSCLLALCP